MADGDVPEGELPRWQTTRLASCPGCGFEPPLNLPLGRWTYTETDDGRFILHMECPLDPRIIPYLSCMPVAHLCDHLELANKELIAEVEQHLADQGGET